MSHASVSADGNTVASSSFDKAIKVWNGSTCVQTLNNNNGVIQAVALTLDGKTLVSGSLNRIVDVYNLEQEQEQSLRRHTGLVTCVAVSADGTTIVSRAADKIVKIVGSLSWRRSIQKSIQMWQFR
ncbi:WD40-repeat-containing domain protein [Obelidium mucronatum]|nr:WD40-repeat-containing domain protein [Obelidium mucronatum]